MHVCILYVTYSLQTCIDTCYTLCDIQYVASVHIIIYMSIFSVKITLKRIENILIPFICTTKQCLDVLQTRFRRMKSKEKMLLNFIPVLVFYPPGAFSKLSLASDWSLAFIHNHQLEKNVFFSEFSKKSHYLILLSNLISESLIHLDALHRLLRTIALEVGLFVLNL